VRFTIFPQRAGLFAITSGLLVAGICGVPAAASAAAGSTAAAHSNRPRPVAPLRFARPTHPADVGRGVHQVCPTPSRPGQMQCQALVSTRVRHGTVMTPADGFIGLTPAELQSAYGVASAAASAGGGETVAIVDAFDDPNAASDLVHYRSAAGLPACADSSGTGSGDGCLTKVNQTGGATPGDTDPSGGWEAEESLDLDMVSALCPNCHILLVEASSASLANLAAAENFAATAAKFVSNSWGSNSEFIGERSFDAAFNHPGVAITAAAGDTGYGTEYPAVSPFVTSVGGTSLHQVGGSWVQEAWDGTGSGCSVLEPAPSWQEPSVSVDGCLNRTETDVSASADPAHPVGVYDTFPADGVTVGWNEFGGTSEATPIITAIYALAGDPTAGTYPASYLYQNTSALTDITTGPANGICESNRQYLCNAETGYDGPTGWGTPNGTVPFAEGVSGDVVTVDNPGTQDYRVGRAVNLWMSGHDSAAHALTYTASGLPAGLSISSDGLISGTPTSATTASVTVTATAPGPVTGSVSFTIVTVQSLLTSFHPVAGPVGFGVAGKCMDDRNNAAWNGNPIQVWTCNGKTRQNWTFLPRGTPGGAGTLTIHQKCLRELGTQNGSQVVLWTCNGATSERWLLAGFGALVNVASGKCLAGPASGANGTQLWVNACTFRTNQSWKPPASPIPSGVAGKCVDDRNNASTDGNAVQIWTCSGFDRQKWAVRPEGTLRIHGKCLAVSTGSPLNGAAIDLSSCDSFVASLVWLPGPGGELINGESGKCLADPGSSTTDGKRLRLEDCYGHAGEIWALS
jgi:Ricin-type beta-trefoil lectin domain/Putative Ig domain